MVLAVASKGLSVGYEEVDGVLWAVRDVSIEVKAGETFCLAGESGSGKSTIAGAIAGILPPHTVTKGELYINGRTVIRDETRDYEGIRGRVVTYVPQSPGASLNPYMTIEEQFYSVLKSLYGLNKRESKERAKVYLQMVELDPDSVLDDYPHELSGGMQQRAAIALALSTGARILVADEPTSALDAHLRLQIVEELSRLRRETGVTLVFISHDLLLAGAICDRMAVMYAGVVAEVGGARAILEKPLHPYTLMLVESTPRLDRRKQLKPFLGEPPKPGELTNGCPFFNRCPSRLTVCAVKMPPLMSIGGERHVACWLYE
ncbi:MAG: ABC transporter ATP-binding protein [Thermofilaceae archaeon]|nr:ABC transporter ATP-binding protein [Thermofilaceae archaeon]MCX8181118.1 ABC transporter ATP-binding protein [Thermofilaceae archaeon]MDW8004876.1 ABC transporter ATP-binding protein [Thermofilaceae archaeon]